MPTLFLKLTQVLVSGIVDSDCFGLKQVKASKKVQQELFTKKKNGETETKSTLDYLRMPKLTRNRFTTVATVCHKRETRCFVKCFAIILLCAKKKKKNFEKHFEETVHK